MSGDILYILDEGPETTYWHAVLDGKLIDLYSGNEKYTNYFFHLCTESEAKTDKSCVAVESSTSKRKEDWWVKVQTKNGVLGWILVNNEKIEGVDGCAVPSFIGTP
jgi:hypothetical protein